MVNFTISCDVILRMTSDRQKLILYNINAITSQHKQANELNVEIALAATAKLLVISCITQLFPYLPLLLLLFIVAVSPELVLILRSFRAHCN